MDEEKDKYNLPIAAFTFGKNGQPLPYYPIQDLKDISKENNINNKKAQSKRNNNNSNDSKGSKDSYKLAYDDYANRFSFKNIINKNNKKFNNGKNNLNKDVNSNNNNYYNNNINNYNFIFIDKEDSNSSYIKIILYALSYMPLFYNYIINFFQTNNEFNNNIDNVGQILLIIHDILIKIDKIKNSNKAVNNFTNINNIINIEYLKENLSDIFKNKNKFLRNFPDDPMDFLYIIFNTFHDLETNDSTKKICNDCFSHKNISIVLYKVYECECQAQSKPILNINNYFLDIPINIIINKFSKINMKDMNQMLFTYYRELIYNIKIKGDCPIYGKRCQINKVHKKYILKKCPSYLVFNLENDFFKKSELFYSLNNILKYFVLISHYLNIKTLFNIKHKNDKVNYELFGILFLKISKVYSCIFKSKDIFYYYEDNLFIPFDNYYDIILFSLKNGNIPISIFYKNNDNNNYNSNYELTSEQINKLEKYVNNTNNLNQNLKNKIRTKENIISDNININYIIKNNLNNPSNSEHYTSSRCSNSINSYNSYQKNEYICSHCERINKIENANCFFCGFDNRNNINNINNNNNNQQNKNIRKLKNNIVIKQKIILKKDKFSLSKNNNELGEIEDEYKNIDPHVIKYFDMPRPYISSKKEITNNTTKQKLSSHIINKSQIPVNTDINYTNYKLQKKAKNLSINNSPKLNNKIYLNKIGNKSLKAMNKSAKNGFISYTNRNSNNNSNNNNLNNLNENEFYTEQNELNKNQLNINLKINNNNNYNIFDFGDKKNLIKLNDLNKYETDENYINEFNSKKLFSTKNKVKKKMNSSRVINYNSPNESWICIHCFNKNEYNINRCMYCKKRRAINNINKSPKSKSTIINENKINFNNMLIGQKSTKNRNKLNKI